MGALLKEHRDLARALWETEKLLARKSRDFWENGGICCPDCGVPGYSELVRKQERRWRRSEQIRLRLTTIPGAVVPQPLPCPY